LIIISFTKWSDFYLYDCFPLSPLFQGVRRSFFIIITMAKIIVPVIFIVVTLDKMDLLPVMAKYLGPFMWYIGLPGEAALPLLLGFFLNIYASLGAIGALNMGAREITVLAIIILTSHSLIVEALVLKFTGLSYAGSLLLRIVTGLFFGSMVNIGYLLLDMAIDVL